MVSYHEEEKHPILEIVDEAFLFMIEIIEESISILFFAINDEQNSDVILDELLGESVIVFVIFFILFCEQCT